MRKKSYQKSEVGRSEKNSALHRNYSTAEVNERYNTDKQEGSIALLCVIVK